MPLQCPHSSREAFNISRRGSFIECARTYPLSFFYFSEYVPRTQAILARNSFALYFSNDFHTAELDNDLLLMLAGIDRADRWLQVALPVARNHPEYTETLEKQADSKFSGAELAKVRQQFAATQRASNTPLAQNIRKIAETIVISAPVDERPQSNTIAGDPELARLAVGLNEAPQFRLWLVLLQMVRDTNINYVLRADLEAMLRKYGITVSERNLRRWLKHGHGLFWNVTEKRIYFAGYKTVSIRLVERAVHKKLPDLISTNRPGKRSMYFDVSGSLQQFEANVYAAWIAFRENPTIARSTLSALFNREPRILRQWDKSANIDVITNEAQFAPDYFAEVPEHGYMYQAALGNGRSETRFRARMVNSYHAPQIKQHGKRGQSRRVFHAVGKYLESIESTGKCEQGRGSNTSTGGLKPTGRRYFADSTKARRSAKHKGDRQRYIALGMNKNQQMVWDYTTDGRQRTTKCEELPIITQCKIRPHLVYAKDVVYA